MTLSALLREHSPALVIGNGINRYGAKATTNSWNDLLIALAKKHIDKSTREIPAGVSLTEFYDSLELAQQDIRQRGTLQQDFCAPMQHWEPDTHHAAITHWAMRHRAPILTSNFDDLLARSSSSTLHSLHGESFTDFYPWNRYFAQEPVKQPHRGFGIWHINGTMHYRRSIRLGLTHYMGSVERARQWLHKGQERSLFRSRHPDRWAGADTWLHVLFHRPLLIMGLGLEENEVFLRWLLIERARYFKEHPKRKQPAWYAHVGKESDGKRYFLRSVGITMLEIPTYDDLYGSKCWAQD